MSSEKFVSKEGEMHQIENKDMHCKGCVFAYKDSTVECVKYKQKPLAVIRGAACNLYKKK